MPMAVNARNVDLVLPDPEAGNGMLTPTASLRVHTDHVGPEGAGSPGDRPHRISAHPKTSVHRAMARHRTMAKCKIMARFQTMDLETLLHSRCL